jgi:transposase
LLAAKEQPKAMTSQKKTSKAKPTRAKARRRKSQGPRRPLPQGIPVIEANAAGIDVGAREMYVAIPPDRDPEPVRVYPTFTCDLEALADWLVERGITTVAMESTGVYWIPLYQILEERGIRVCLVNARHMKNVPGRRTDWHECQWLQYLHTVGLLRAAFRPEQQVVAVRSVVRHRKKLVELLGVHVRHVHKALTQMNLQIHHVINDITGVTGTAIIEAILAGERDAAVLAKLRQPEIHADEETIRKSLEGDWRREHLFALRQSWEMYREYVRAIEACDKEICEMLSEHEPKVDPAEKPLPPDNKKRKKRHHKRPGDFRFDVRTEAYKQLGVDVTRIPGLEGIALMLYCEVGNDMSRWPNGSQFASWTALCPDNDKTGGQVQWTGVRQVKNRTGQLFRQAANGLHHSQTQMGAYLRRMKAKLGSEGGITATAHKIARVFYAVVKNQVEYDETIWDRQDQERQRRLEAKIRRQAHGLGYQLVPIQPVTSGPSPASH